MKKRMVALMLGMLMLVSSLTGCGSSEEAKQPSADAAVESSDAAEDAEEGEVQEGETEEVLANSFAGTELTIAILRKSTDTTDTFNDKIIIKMVEEATGIHVNWIEVDEAVANERINVMLSESEQPDVYLGLLSDDALITNAEMFYDLSEEGLLETYAPHVLEIYDEILADGADVRKMLTMPDGTMRSLASNSAVSPTSDAAGIQMINKAWLDKLGLPIPTTADEFYDTLCAFRDNDMNGNGIADEIPMSFCNADGNAHIFQYANAFGIAGGHRIGAQNPFLMVKDGTVTSTVDTKEWRAYLEFYNKLISEGLVDAEGFSQTSEQFNAKIAENKVGVYSGWTPATGDGLEFVTFRPFQALDGVEVVKSGNDGYYFGKLSGFVVTKDSKNVEAALTWWDYLHSSGDIMNTAYCGEKDVVWFTTEDGDYYDDYSTDEAQANNWHNAITTNTCPQRPWRVFTGKRGTRFEMANEVRDLLVPYAEDIQVGLVDPLITEERTFIETDLFDYIKSYAAEAMMDGVTDESWNEYLEGLKEYQYYEWLDWYQRYMDGEF